MTFAAPAPTEGTIAPEGGCPANFFTSRLRARSAGDPGHTRKLLVVLKPNTAGRFEGELPNGEVVWLER